MIPTLSDFPAFMNFDLLCVSLYIFFVSIRPPRIPDFLVFSSETLDLTDEVLSEDLTDEVLSEDLTDEVLSEDLTDEVLADESLVVLTSDVCPFFVLLFIVSDSVKPYSDVAR